MLSSAVGLQYGFANVAKIQKRPIAENTHVESRWHVIKGTGPGSWLCPYGNLQKIMNLDKMSWFLRCFSVVVRKREGNSF